MKVIATDTVGNEFPKTVTKQESLFEYSKGETLISFGWPVECMASFIMKHYPYQHPFIIDEYGKNHKGHPVEVSADDMNKIVEELIQKQ